MRRVGGSRISFFQVGALVLAVICVLTYFGFAKSVPFRSHYEVKAVFKSANNIRPNSPVRIAGVNVGKVTEVTHLRKGDPAAVVHLRIDKKGLPIHTDAKATIRPRIFLEGNFFVDLRPGSPSADELADGDTIPVNNTAAPVQLDQILTSLQDDTRQDLQTLLKEYGKALEGEGAGGFNRSIEFWEPAYKNSAIVNDATQGLLDHDLSNYVKNAGATAEALDRNGEQLKSLITDFRRTAGAFAVRQEELEAAIGELPRTLEAGLPALRALNDAFPATRRLISALRPAVRSSGPAIDASLPFVRQARQLVSPSELRGLTKDLRPTVPSIAALNNATTPLLRQVRAASSCQNEVILPWTHDKIQDSTFPATGEVFQEAPKPLPGLAGESRSGDSNGQWFRVLLNGGPTFAYPQLGGQFLLTNEPIQGANPPKPTERPPLRADVPCETQERPDLRTRPAAPPAGFRIKDGDPTRLAKTQAAAVEWLEKQLKVENLDEQLDVVEQPLKAAQLPQLRASWRKAAGR